MVEVMKRGTRGRIPRPKTWQSGIELCLTGTIRGIDYPTDTRWTVNRGTEAHGDRAEAFASEEPETALECLTLTVSDLAREGDVRGAAHWQTLADSLAAWIETPFSERDPWDEPEPERKEHKRKARTEDELAAFFGAINRKSDSGKRFYAIALLARNTGARISEVLNLKRDDLDWRGSTMWIADSKTGKPRGAIITHIDATRAAIEDWYTVRESWNPSSDYVFVTRPGKADKGDERVCYGSVKRGFDTVSERAGLAYHITPHHLRHTFVSMALANGAPEAGLCKQGGWANPRVLRQIYQHVVDQEQQDAARAFEGYGQKKNHA